MLKIAGQPARDAGDERLTDVPREAAA